MEECILRYFPGAVFHPKEGSILRGLLRRVSFHHGSDTPLPAAFRKKKPGADTKVSKGHFLLAAGWFIAAGGPDAARENEEERHEFIQLEFAFCKGRE